MISNLALGINHKYAPDEQVAAGIGVLSRALTNEARLSLIGALAARWDIARLTGNLRRLALEEMRDPSILEEPIEAPIVITGLPRSGTSFLHDILAQDSANQVLTCWQAIHPYPLSAASDRRPQKAARQLALFGFLAPEMRGVHPLSSTAPQECTEITAHVFQSLRFDMTHHVPSYREWLNAQGHLAAYRFHKRFLQHLQHQSDVRRWVLKAPDHIFALSALRRVYPDAKFIFVHRDPARILPSVARLTEIVRYPFSRAVDPLQIGRQVTRDWKDGAERMMAADRAPGGASIFHLHYRDIADRPLDAIRRLYRHFGLGLSPRSAETMAQRIAAKPDGGYGRNIYRPERYGMKPEALEADFRRYVEHFGVSREADARGRLHRPRLERGDSKVIPLYTEQGEARSAGGEPRPRRAPGADPPPKKLERNER